MLDHYPDAIRACLAATEKHLELLRAIPGVGSEPVMHELDRVLGEIRSVVENEGPAAS